jgi:hypothetical protein
VHAHAHAEKNTTCSVSDPRLRAHAPHAGQHAVVTHKCAGGLPTKTTHCAHLTTRRRVRRNRELAPQAATPRRIFDCVRYENKGALTLVDHVGHCNTSLANTHTGSRADAAAARTTTAAPHGPSCSPPTRRTAHKTSGWGIADDQGRRRCSCTAHQERPRTPPTRFAKQARVPAGPMAVGAGKNRVRNGCSSCEHVKGGQGIAICPCFSKEPGTGRPLFVCAKNLEEVVAVVETAANVLTTQIACSPHHRPGRAAGRSWVSPWTTASTYIASTGSATTRLKPGWRACARRRAGAVSADATAHTKTDAPGDNADAIAPTATGAASPAPIGGTSTGTGGAPAAKRPQPLLVPAETTPAPTTRDSTL